MLLKNIKPFVEDDSSQAASDAQRLTLTQRLVSYPSKF